MGFRDITNKIQKAANDFKDNQAEKKAVEEARKNNILMGNIAPIQVTFNLQPEEVAYLSVDAKRLANVEHVVEKTTGKTKKKGMVTRGIVGGALLGPVGLIAGAATAGSKVNTQTTHETITKLEAVDKGTAMFTNKRMIFVGSTITAIPYADILAYSFKANHIGNGAVLSLKYEAMLPNEQFAVSGQNAKDVDLYYRGITTHLLK